jgi:hypothetical protein
MEGRQSASNVIRDCLAMPAAREAFNRDEFFNAISASVELKLISVKFSAAANRGIGDCQQDAARRLALD